jgi:pyrimidine deaminase RibD-like protein
MNLKELDSFKLSDAVTFHDTLNPKLWRNNNLRPEVKKQLLIIAQDFLEELGVSNLDVKDITVSGSNAAFSYTPHSDLDLHILVDMGNLPNDEIYKELFNAKKNIYNDNHNIKIHGVPVELYVQDAREPVVSLGEYSIKDDKWLRLPTKRRANFDQTATKSKYEKLLNLVEIGLQSKDIGKVSNILKKIKQYRQAGLDKGGEFGPENLAYKALRSQGLITKLYDLRDKLHDEILTIETMYQDPVKVQRDNLKEKLSKEFEDWHPNATPPGPEFKPTMPAGTVRVDVSDVYDWYKLGQHISNMKGLGKHDFGKGPPSTILAFGDEDTEHKYIKDLEKTGLTTTDIDPVDPNQPKGMKRQKVDPTFNVNETSDEEISNYSKLDKVLIKLCNMVIKGQDSDKDYGMVAACVIDPDTNAVARLNYLESTAKRVHAERAAVEAYENKYGEVPEGSIVVTTLSPCNESNDETAEGRVGESCTDYLNSKGIKKVYCGYTDPTQDNDQRQFNIIETSDKSIREECKKFADTFLNEARVNPDQNIKYESGMKELEAIANTISDPENWAVSMTSEPKLGINPQVGISEDTPKGIYFYPLNYVLGMIKSRRPLPWGNDYPYIQLFQYDRSGEMTEQTKVDPAKLKQALLQYCPEEVIQQAIDDPEYDGTPYYFIYDCLSRLGKSDETNVVRWNKVLRDLGFTSVFDPGEGWIAYNEPTQGVVLDPRIIKQHKTIANRKESKVITPARIAQLLFDEIDMELARNRIWQLYDPDGSKLRQAVKKYAEDPKFKPYMGKPGSQELEDKIKGYRLYGARQLSDVAMDWYKAQQQVNEAFDQPYRLKWEHGDYGDVDAYAKMDDGNYLSIMFNKGFSQGTKEEAWNVEFFRNNSQEVTGEGDAQRVFATVLSAIQKFIKKYKPNRVIFSASKELDPTIYYGPDDIIPNPESRAKLYDRLVPRYARSWGFRAFRADTGNKVIYELSRIKSVKENDTMQYAAEKTSATNPYGGFRDVQYRGSISEASGYIPSEKEKNDPRFKTALTVDIKPDSIKKNAKAFSWLTDRAGIPPTAKPNGKI